MSRARAIRYSACGCVFLLWAGSAPAETTTASLSPATNADSSSSAATAPAAASPFATDDCQVTDACIDRYLWALYQRTPKIDAVKVPEKQKVTVKRKGKTRTVVKTVIRIVDQDFTWKDFAAADKAGLSPMAYVIGGMDRDFKRTLYHALRVMDDAGLMPGITSAFRDDYRQGIASGNKAATDRSFHGGSRRGGYGRGLAVDLVSVRGATRAERWRSSEELWTWIDANGRDVGIGRPYLHRDAPHVTPIDGKEYAMKRGGAKTRLAAAKTAILHRQARRDVRGARHAGKIASKTVSKAVSKTVSSKSRTGQIRAKESAVSAKGRARKSAS